MSGQMSAHEIRIHDAGVDGDTEIQFPFARGDNERVGMRRHPGTPVVAGPTPQELGSSRRREGRGQVLGLLVSASYKQTEQNQQKKFSDIFHLFLKIIQKKPDAEAVKGCTK